MYQEINMIKNDCGLLTILLYGLILTFSTYFIAGMNLHGDQLLSLTAQENR